MQYTLHCHCIVNNKKPTFISKQYTSFTDFKNMGATSEERRTLHPKTKYGWLYQISNFLDI